MKDIQFNFDNSYINLPEIFYTKINPIKVSNPKIVFLNENLMSELGLDFNGIADDTLAALFSGNVISKGSEPIAIAYAGHQFGNFTILGDGRAHFLGEHITPNGKRYDIQLKGSGRTPYGRRGDGRAALAPMLRE
jgi:uncharacterized protein YdiU (UPF0061 family)